MIRVITLAPELPGSDELIKACVEMGMVVAIGHTAATTDDIKRAADAGATLSTHLGNGCHATLPRHPNYIWDQLAEDRLYASMIADGFHLSDAVLKVFIASKSHRAVLISDGMTYTGLKPGVYESSATGRVRLTSEGKLHTEENESTLAGSASTLFDGVRHVTRLAGLSGAWDMGSVHPSKLMDSTSDFGLYAGAKADVVLLKSVAEKLEKPEILEVYKNGVQFTPAP
jgi:N-acetylglucosamine-6-phosphate deacetylase